MGKIKHALKRSYDKLYVPFDKGAVDDAHTVRNEEFFAPVIALLGEGKSVTIPVKGFSMLPFIRGRKDLVEIRKADTYRKRDIVLFDNHGRTILHRIVRVEGDNVTIQGDGVASNQEHVTLADIHGKAVKILRNGKREVNPDNRWQHFRSWLWDAFKWMRTPLIWTYRLLPWNYVWLRKQ
ncbi:MAG: S24/S26 family peptidase [Bacteroidales bacterium]|nr:S24/S26 family peptidase [Bacteroidales bacterium]